MVKKLTKKAGGACGGSSCWAGGKRGKVGKSRRLRGGMYGVGQPITAGALEYGAAYTGPVGPDGGAVPDPTDPAGGYTGIGGRKGRKTRKGRKGSKKGSKKSRRKMRGGASQVSMGTVGYGYTGTGAGGLTDATQYTTQGNAF